MRGQGSSPLPFLWGARACVRFDLSPESVNIYYISVRAQKGLFFYSRSPVVVSFFVTALYFAAAAAAAATLPLKKSLSEQGAADVSRVCVGPASVHAIPGYRGPAMLGRGHPPPRWYGGAGYGELPRCERREVRKGRRGRFVGTARASSSSLLCPDVAGGRLLPMLCGYGKGLVVVVVVVVVS